MRWSIPGIATKSVDEKADYMIGQIADIVKVTNIPTDLTEFGVRWKIWTFWYRQEVTRKDFLLII